MVYLMHHEHLRLLIRHHHHVHRHLLMEQDFLSRRYQIR
jgi:hypothetical protein